MTREIGKPIKETKQMTAEISADAVSHNLINWHAIDWHKVRENVRRLQARIVKFTAPRPSSSGGERVPVRGVRKA
jgi:hypothetical protein